MTLEFQEILIRLLVAAIIGTAIGVERNIHGRPAGLRTHMLVSLGSALFMLVSINLPGSALGHLGVIASDPARIAAQIVTGIGFLGAGVIIKDGMNVRGLTTAACLWMAAATGMAAGAGEFTLVGVATVIGLAGLVGLHKVESLYARDAYFILHLTLKGAPDAEKIRDQIAETGVLVPGFSFERDYDQDLTLLRYQISIHAKNGRRKKLEELVAQLEQSDLRLVRLLWKRA